MNLPNEKLKEIQRIAEIEFEDIVNMAFFVNYKLRIVLIDKSFIDIGISQRIQGRFSFHWEYKNGLIYRYDNFPDKQWERVSTFPFHFHNGSQNMVEAAPFSFELITGFREFMEFARVKLLKKLNNIVTSIGEND